MEKHITVPMKREEREKLKSGDYVYITGTVYTARDAAHKRMMETLERGEKLPIELKDNVIYYMGPTPAREGRVIGSAGPTTASRMDKYTPKLLDLNDRKRKTHGRCKKWYHKKWRRLFCRGRRSRRTAFQMYRKRRSNSI